MRKTLLFALFSITLSVVVACSRASSPLAVTPVQNLGDIDSLTILIHVDHPCAGVSGEILKREVLEALELAGIAVSDSGAPYLHVRAYARAGTSTVYDDETPRGPPASWHFGMWIDRTTEYSNVSGPLTNICPAESALWWRGGTGPLAEGKLLDSVRTWMSEFVDDYRTAGAQNARRW